MDRNGLLPASGTNGGCNCLAAFQTELEKITQKLQVTECELKTYKRLYHEAIEHINRANLAKTKIDKISSNLKESLDEVGLLLNFDVSESPIATGLQKDLNKTFACHVDSLPNTGSRSTELEKDCKNIEPCVLHFEHDKRKRSTLKQKKSNESPALPKKRNARRKRSVSKDVKTLEKMEIVSDEETNATTINSSILEQQNLIPSPHAQMNAKKSSMDQVSVNKKSTKCSRKSKNERDRTSNKISSLPPKVRKMSEPVITEGSHACNVNEKVIDVTKKIVPANVLKENVMNKDSVLTDHSLPVEIDELLIAKYKKKNTHRNSLAGGTIQAENQKKTPQKNSKVYDTFDDMPSLDVLSSGYKRKKM